MNTFSGVHIQSFLGKLQPLLVRQLTQAGYRRHFSDGQMIHSRGDMQPGVSIIEEGGAQVGIHGLDGAFILTSYLGRGHTFGEFTVFTGLPRTHDVSAVGRTVLLEIPARNFLAICEREPSCLQALLTTALMRSHMFLEMLDAIRRLALLPRVAKFLLLLSPDGSDSPRIRFRQSDLASSVGVSRASLNSALGQLAKIGLVERGYGFVRLNDRAALESWLARQAKM